MKNALLSEQIEFLISELVQASGIRLSNSLLSEESFKKAIGSDEYEKLVEKTESYALLTQLDAIAKFILDFSGFVSNSQSSLLGSETNEVDGFSEFPHLSILCSISKASSQGGSLRHVVDGTIKHLSLACHDLPFVGGVCSHQFKPTASEGNPTSTTANSENEVLS